MEMRREINLWVDKNFAKLDFEKKLNILKTYCSLKDFSETLVSFYLEELFYARHEILQCHSSRMINKAFTTGRGGLMNGNVRK
jgi:hypothetical protein